MPKLVSLYDSTGRRNYLGYGRFRSLISRARFRLDRRNTMDKAFLRVQSLFGSGKEQVQDNLWNNIQKNFAEPIQKALLFNTSWYKDTQYIGLVQQEDTLFFIKVFNKHEDVLFQSHVANFVEQNFTDYFQIAPVVSARDKTLVLQYIQHKHEIRPHDLVDQKIIRLSKDFMSTSTITKQAKDILPIDLGAVFMRQGFAEDYNRINDWALRQEKDFKIIPIHGDMTPWNMFVSDQGKVVLIDYESAGWHVAFYDYFHFLLQPVALKKAVPSIHKISFEAGYDPNSLILYLVDQLHHHLNRGAEPDKALRNLIKNKMKWLRELLDAA